MTTKKIFFGAVLAAVMVISMTSYAIAQPAWTSVTDFDVNEVGNITVLSLQAADNIPHTADDFVNSNAVVGFAWADLDALVLVVATIHPVLGDDSNQNPNAWHPHTATLIVAGEEGEETLCLASVDTTFESGLSINQDSMSLRINNADLPYDVADIDGAVGFALNGDTTGNCPAVPGLGFGVAVTLL